MKPKSAISESSQDDKENLGVPRSPEATLQPFEIVISESRRRRYASRLRITLVVAVGIAVPAFIIERNTPLGNGYLELIVVGSLLGGILLERLLGSGSLAVRVTHEGLALDAPGRSRRRSRSCRWEDVRVADRQLHGARWSLLTYAEGVGYESFDIALEDFSKDQVRLADETIRLCLEARGVNVREG